MKFVRREICFLSILLFTIISCNSYNKKMNGFLKDKKNIEITIDKINARDQRFRLLTGNSEILDSLSISPNYKYPKLVDSIYFMKEMKDYLEEDLET